MSEAQKQKAIKANLFGQGFEDGHRSSIGCSYKGRIWSYRTANLLTLTTWCRGVGAKLLDEELDPEEVLRGTLVPELVSKRPSKMPVAVEWPPVFYREPEQLFSFRINGAMVYRHDADIALTDPSDDGPLAFAVASEAASAAFEVELKTSNGNPDFTIKSRDGADATISYRGRTLSLREFFEHEPPTFWFADGSSLTGIEFVALRKQPVPFPKERIQHWNWTGTKIRTESQGIERNPESIQHRVISEMKKRTFSLIFDDDDHGEAADVVGIVEENDHIAVEFWHCKFAMDDKPGSRIKELYELCGQAQTSIRWLEKPRDLFTHLLRREPRRCKGKEGTRYEVGTEKDLLRIREKADIQPVRLRVFVVQPGLSIAKVSKDQLELLAVTENYLKETFAVALEIVGNASEDETNETVFAYGSNMCSGRFRAYGIAPKDEGRPALLSGYRLLFNKKSDDGSGKANVEPHTGGHVWGVVYTIPTKALQVLDKGEKGYARKKLTVEIDGVVTDTWVYLAASPDLNSALRPYSWYKRFLVEGAREHGIALEYLAELERIDAAEDPNRERDRKKRAIACRV